MVSENLFEHFSNLHFVFAAGAAEVALGLLLIVNVASRLASLILAGMFAVSSVVFGMTEAIGHLPILGVSLLLALHGSEQARLPALLANWRLSTVQPSRSGAYAAPRLVPGE